MGLNLKFKPHGTYNTTKQVQDFIQASTVYSGTLFNTVVLQSHQGCHNWSVLYFRSSYRSGLYGMFYVAS
jgi:hypothetical protein